MLATIQEEYDIVELDVFVGKPGDPREFMVHVGARLQVWPGFFELLCRNTVHPVVSLNEARFSRFDRRTMDVFTSARDYRIFFDSVFDLVEFWHTIIIEPK